MKKFFTLMVITMTAIGSLAAQDNQRTAKGYVIDNNGNPIAGAEVMATGGGETTITDADGSFRLTVSPFLKSITATYTGMGSKKLKTRFDKDMIFRMKPKTGGWFIDAVGLGSIGGGIPGGGGGLMGGYLGKWGGYAKVTLDSEVCPNITAGVIKSFSRVVYGYLGLGYGQVVDYYEGYRSYYNYYTDTYQYSYYDEYWYYDGMAFDLGVIFKTSRHFNFSVGVTFATDFADSYRTAFNLGVGYVF